MALEKTLKRPLDCKETKPVHPKGNQSWIFIGRTDAETEASILWTPDAKNWLIGKNPDAGKDWREKERTTEDEMVGWHHWLNGHEFEQTLERWWRTGKPVVLQAIGLQRAGHFWATEQQQKNKNKIRAYHLVCRLRSCHIWDARFKQEKKSQLLRHLRYFQGDF